MTFLEEMRRDRMRGLVFEIFYDEQPDNPGWVARKYRVINNQVELGSMEDTPLDITDFANWKRARKEASKLWRVNPEEIQVDMG